MKKYLFLIIALAFVFFVRFDFVNADWGCQIAGCTNGASCSFCSGWSCSYNEGCAVSVCAAASNPGDAAYWGCQSGYVRKTNCTTYQSGRCCCDISCVSPQGAFLRSVGPQLCSSDGGGSVPTSVNGSCGTANGVAVNSAPTTNLCSAGTATTVSGGTSGPWSWSCNGSGGGSNVSCSAPVTSCTYIASVSTWSICQAGFNYATGVTYASSSTIPASNVSACNALNAPIIRSCPCETTNFSSLNWASSTGSTGYTVYKNDWENPIAILSTSTLFYNATNTLASDLFQVKSYISTLATYQNATPVMTANLNPGDTNITPVMVANNSFPDVSPIMTSNSIFTNLVDVTPMMSADITGLHITSASSVLNSGYPAYKAFDPLTTGANAWHSAATGPWWLKLDYGNGASKIIKQYSITSGQWSDRTPRSFTFEGSNDDSTWTVLDTRINESVYSTDEIRSYAFNNNTSYRFYRLNVTASSGGSYVAISDLMMFEDSGVIASASSELNSSYPAYKAFDPLTTGANAWHSAATGPWWLKLDYGNGASKIIKQYSITSGQWSDRTPRSFTFEGSNDGTNWTVLDTRVNESGYTTDEVRNYAFSNNTSYRFYKLNITASSNNAYVAISDLRFGDIGASENSIASATSENNVNTLAFKAFDNNDTTYWRNTIGKTGQLGLDLGSGNSKTVVRYSILPNFTYAPVTWSLQGSNDGVNWTNLDTQNNLAWSGVARTFTFVNNKSYRYYRLDVLNSMNSYIFIHEVKLYSTDTSPSVSATSENAVNTLAYNAFDNNDATYWRNTIGKTGQITLDYGSGNAKKIVRYSILPNFTYAPVTWVLQGSNDNTNWTNLDSQSNLTWGGVLKTFTFTNNASYRYYRFDILNSTNGYIFIHEVKFSDVLAEAAITDSYVDGLSGVFVPACDTSLSTTCYSTPNRAVTGDLVTWTATSTGGDGSYAYTWTGTGGGGTGQSINKIYTTAGLATSSVYVTSGTATTSVNCHGTASSTGPCITNCGINIDARGDCGSAQDSISSTTPSNNLCSTSWGNTSVVSFGSQWLWDCLGSNDSNDEDDVPCTAINPPVYDSALDCEVTSVNPITGSVNVNTSVAFIASSTPSCPSCIKTWRVIDSGNPEGLIVSNDSTENTRNQIFTTIGAKTVGVNLNSLEENTYGLTCTSEVINIVQQGGVIQEI